MLSQVSINSSYHVIEGYSCTHPHAPFFEGSSTHGFVIQLKLFPAPSRLSTSSARVAAAASEVFNLAEYVCLGTYN